MKSSKNTENKAENVTPQRVQLNPLEKINF